MNLEKKYLLKKILEDTFSKLDVDSKVWLSIDVLNIILVLEIRKKLDIEDILFYLFDEIGLIAHELPLIIIPAFTFDFPKTRLFNAFESKPEIGSLPEFIFRKNYHKRSLHPFYSFFFFGNDSQEHLKKANKFLDSVGESSIFNYILKNNFQLLSIGHHYASALSSIHQTEYLMNVDYRELAYFEGQLIDQHKEKLPIGKYNFYLRKRDICDFSGITKAAAKQFYLEKMSKKCKIKVHEKMIASYKLDLTLSNEYILKSHKKTNKLVDYLNPQKKEKSEIITKKESSIIYKEYIN